MLKLLQDCQSVIGVIVALAVIGLTHCKEAWNQAYWKQCQTSNLKHFARIINGFLPLTFFGKRSMVNVWLNSVYTSAKKSLDSVFHAVYERHGFSISISYVCTSLLYFHSVTSSDAVTAVQTPVNNQSSSVRF